LEVADNGRSFDVAHLTKAKWGKHLGLVGMRERVAMVGGKFVVVSAKGSGTTIRATVPLGKAKLSK
jgi:signal transduction histidine kinase